MPQSDERFAGDMPVAPSQFTEQVRPSLSTDVIARYVVDAVRSVPGVTGLHGSHWQDLSSRVRESHTRGTVVRETAPGVVEVEVHVCVAWGASIPELAPQVEEAVRERVRGLLDLEIRRMTLFIDEIEGPPEVRVQPGA
jgi:uncharacterized alkaline shock family protein YloU